MMMMYNCAIKKRKNKRTRNEKEGRRESNDQKKNYAAGTQSLSNPAAQGGAFRGNEALLI